jgi:hypothetical protein
MPVLSVDVFQERIVGSANKLMEKPFGLMLEALDDLKRNEIYLNTGSSPRNALWGEMMSTRALKLGAAGAALNGYNRDTRGILKSMGVDGEQLSALAHFRTRRPATSFLITPQYRSLTTGEAKHQYNGGACSQATNLLPALPESIAICPGLSYEAAGEKSALAELL